MMQEDPYFQPTTELEREELGENGFGQNFINRPRSYIDMVRSRKGKLKQKLVESGTKNRTLTKMK